MEYHERPGVYSSYTMSSIWASGSGSGSVAVAAKYTGAGLQTVTALNQAESLLGETPEVLALVRLLKRNGAGTVLLCPVEADTAAAYTAAVETLLAEKQARFLICDSTDGEVHKVMAEVLRTCGEAGNECIGVVGAADTAAALVTRAKALNCERMVLVAGTASLNWDSTMEGAIYGAAALAGVLCAQEDPALPVNGQVLDGLASVAETFSETEIDTLVQGGVTVLEGDNTGVSPVRAVTTRTLTDGAADPSWREVTTIMIVDDVIPGVRNALKARFLRKKNNETTRGAIRSQVAVELESRMRREIIDSYGEISVEPDDTDPTICQVAFSFSVVHGISRIYLTAHITV